MRIAYFAPGTPCTGDSSSLGACGRLGRDATSVKQQDVIPLSTLQRGRCCSSLWESMTSSAKPEVPNVLQPPKEDRVTTTGSMHRKFGVVRVCVSRVKRVDRQADRHAHHSIPCPYRGGLTKQISCFLWILSVYSKP